jgi:hypothetical protein
MQDISRPFVTENDPDRDVRCLDALHSAFNELVARATAAGWHEQEVLESILTLAEDRSMRTPANDLSAMLGKMLAKMR